MKIMGYIKCGQENKIGYDNFASKKNVCTKTIGYEQKLGTNYFGYNFFIRKDGVPVSIPGQLKVSFENWCTVKYTSKYSVYGEVVSGGDLDPFSVSIPTSGPWAQSHSPENLRNKTIITTRAPHNGCRRSAAGAVLNNESLSEYFFKGHSDHNL